LQAPGHCRGHMLLCEYVLADDAVCQVHSNGRARRLRSARRRYRASRAEKRHAERDDYTLVAITLRVMRNSATTLAIPLAR
jgi:hypothetical protein